MKIDIFKVRQPMKLAFNHAESGRSASDSVILRFTYQQIEALGECAPRSYVTGQTVDSVIDELEQINLPQIIDHICVDSFVDSLNRLQNRTWSYSLCVTCIIEMAILDWIGKTHEMPLWKILNYIRDISEFSNNFRVSSVMDLSLNPSDFIKERGPFHVVKIKVTKDLATDIKRIREIRTRLGNKINIILDANMCWDLDTARTYVRELSEFNILYYEEPLKKGSFTDYRELRNSTACNIMLDESVCSQAELAAAIQHEACDAVNIRISKNGGLLSSLAMMNTCREHGLLFQIGSQVAEVGPLICAGRHLRTITPDVVTYEGGQPDRWFDEFIVEPIPLVDRNEGVAKSINRPGLGCNSTSSLERIGIRYGS